MKKTIPFLAFFLFNFFASEAQFTRYIVKFTDKGSNPFSLSNPSQYLSQRALDRRARYNITIDSMDLPVTPRYIDSLRLAGDVTILTVSKWLNQVAIRTSDAAALQKINALPFVQMAAPIGSRIQPGADVPVNKVLDPGPGDIISARPAEATGHYNYGVSNGQVKIHNGDFLHNHGFRGEGMHLSVLDAGFYHYETLPTFDSIRANGQVLATWDFVENNESVDEDNAHGMQCLSTIAANLPGVFVGTAPKASFYLFRTEDVNSEYPIEEQNLAAGSERADSLGVDICTVSLGYFHFDNPVFNYTYADFDGNTSISARAADIAAKKGMLMVVAAGNEGDKSWHYLITPADADSVLTVGAVDTTGNVAGFSSYGPSSDGQIKPGVAAVGAFAIIANTGNGMPAYGFGTSFACPNMAGIATCLWQAFPEVNNMRIIDVLQQSANNVSAPNDRIGYGIPDVKKAFVMLQKQTYTNQSGISGCRPFIKFSIKTDNTMNIVVERKLANANAYTPVQTLTAPAAFGLHDFTFEDNVSSVVPSTVTYRLQVNIGADTSYYLDPVSVEHLQNCQSSGDVVSVSPNPVSTDLNITVNQPTAAKVNLFLQNGLGQIIYSREIQQAAGTQNYRVDMMSASPGTYFVTVYSNNKKIRTLKVVKEK